jgi:malonyl-CoA O-methyltransferase
MANNIPLNKTEIAKSFSRAATTYDSAALLPLTVGKRLLEKLELMPLQPQHIIDLGCGTGLLTQELSLRHPTATLLAIDIAANMLHVAQQKRPTIKHFICAEATSIPVADESVELVFSNLTLAWCCADLLTVFTEIKRVLKPGGLWLFSTLGPDTLQELKQSFAAVDTHPHIHQFADMHNIGDYLLQTGFHMPVMEMEKIILAYRHAHDLTHDLKMLGAHNLDPKRHRALTPKSHKQKLAATYEQFRNADHLLPATFEIIYGHAWQPASTLEVPASKSGETLIPISKISKRREK